MITYILLGTAFTTFIIAVIAKLTLMAKTRKMIKLLPTRELNIKTLNMFPLYFYVVYLGSKQDYSDKKHINIKFCLSNLEAEICLKKFSKKINKYS